jgi:hypothetical protein
MYVAIANRIINIIIAPIIAIGFDNSYTYSHGTFPICFGLNKTATVVLNILNNISPMTNNRFIGLSVSNTASDLVLYYVLSFCLLYVLFLGASNAQVQLRAEGALLPTNNSKA